MVTLRVMPGQKKTQKTAKGHVIPVPKRKDFDAILDKVAKKPLPPRSPKK